MFIPLPASVTEVEILCAAILVTFNIKKLEQQSFAQFTQQSCKQKSLQKFYSWLRGFVQDQYTFVVLIAIENHAVCIQLDAMYRCKT